MSELRDAIAFDALDDVDVDCMAHCYGGTYDKREAADAVLAMPEMQSIRKALRDMCASIDFAHGEPLRHGDEDRLASYGLPASVIAWVLEGEQ